MDELEVAALDEVELPVVVDEVPGVVDGEGVLRVGAPVPVRERGVWVAPRLERPEGPETGIEPVWGWRPRRRPCRRRS
jgi:hypothetical protein